MKKWIALLLAAVLCLSLAACGGKAETSGNDTQGQQTSQNTQQTGDESSKTEPVDSEPPEASAAPVADKEELEGLWLSDDGTCLLIQDGVATFYPDVTSYNKGPYAAWAAITMYDWTIAGNRMSFKDAGGGGPHVYEIINEDGQLSLKYVESESGEAYLPRLEMLACKKFTAVSDPQ